MEKLPKLAQFQGHSDCVYCVIPGPEPGSFISSGGDGQVVLWNVAEPDRGRLLARVKGSVYTLCLIPEEELLLIACNRDGLHLLDLKTEKEIWNMASPETHWFRSRRHGQTISLSGSKGTFLQVEWKEKKVNTFQLGADDLRAFSISPDNQWMAFGNSGGHVLMYNQAAQNFTENRNLHSGTVFSLLFYPAVNQMVTAGKDAKIKKWAISDTGETALLQETAAHLFGIHDITLHPSKPILASCSMDKTIKIWDAETLKLLRVLDRARHAGHGHSINQILWLSKPELLLSCSDDRTISAWDIFA